VLYASSRKKFDCALAVLNGERERERERAWGHYVKIIGWAKPHPSLLSSPLLSPSTERGSEGVI